ncbi:NAD-dependent epimerase/dehydratase family protein [Bordetella sp. N]|uniref:NAD-dependent epimerase/dehydratase family protein n=1 Tax=Bordetella sp. N TaxID=1746199 RepID=UPI00070E156B|nr:NAD-dependent epimerase/dehydratase family protein [Bordetella sp. N]ALM83908.1 NAD(P)-dependent oxidoreductase [Bordetella sp. N]
MTAASQPETNAERVLLIGGGDLGMRVAARLLGPGPASPDPTQADAPGGPSRNRDPANNPALWILRRHPPAAASAGRGPGNAIQWLAADVTQPATLTSLPRGITRLIYVLAPDARAPQAYRDIFLDGPRHLLDALDTSALRRMVFVSSSAVYGEHHGAWIDEDTPPAPQGMNGEILLQAEQWLAGQGLPITALRLAGLYGPGRTQLLERLRQGLARVPRAVPHWANRMHADDAAAAIAHLVHLADADSLYVGADDTPLPLDVLYDHLARLLGAPPPAEGPPPAGVGSKRMSNARLRGSGLELAWPDSREGYARLVESQ